ncbi:MAG: hypothetical protein FD135_4028 [Comamonadaceae bacterium]|nr:MAG: hypothetical protein FD135_4028 [Comamonadaceae bacterium]
MCSGSLAGSKQRVRAVCPGHRQHRVVLTVADKGLELGQTLRAGQMRLQFRQDAA